MGRNRFTCNESILQACELARDTITKWLGEFRCGIPVTKGLSRKLNR